MTHAGLLASLIVYWLALYGGWRWLTAASVPTSFNPIHAINCRPHPMISDRQRVEALLLPQMMLAVLEAGVNDPTHPDAQTTRALLLAASREPINDMADKDRSKILRRMNRIHLQITAPYRQEDARVDKVGLITFYLLQAITESGYMELHAGSSMQRAMDLLLPALEPSANIVRLDTSARKAARKVLAELQREGYYTGVTMEAACPE